MFLDTHFNIISVALKKNKIQLYILIDILHIWLSLYSMKCLTLQSHAIYYLQQELESKEKEVSITILWFYNMTKIIEKGRIMEIQ